MNGNVSVTRDHFAFNVNFVWQTWLKFMDDFCSRKSRCHLYTSYPKKNVSGCFSHHKKVHNEMKTISFHQRKLIDGMQQNNKVSRYRMIMKSSAASHVLRVPHTQELLAFHYSYWSGKYEGILQQGGHKYISIRFNLVIFTKITVIT